MGRRRYAQRPQRHGNCAMVIATARSEGIDSAIFAVAAVVAIITMHDAMGVRHETGEQAKVLNQMIEQWIEVSEKNAPFLQNMHLKEMVGHTPLQVVAGFWLGIAGRPPLPDGPGETHHSGRKHDEGRVML